MNERINTSDALCKKVLSIKGIVSYLLKDCVDEFHKLSNHEIMDCCQVDNDSKKIRLLNSEDTSKVDAKIVYDLLMKISVPDEEELFLNLEPQGEMKNLETLLKRISYTISKLIVRQKNDPDGFHNSSFHDLKKCVSIWIVLNAPKKLKGTQMVFTGNDFKTVRGNDVLLSNQITQLQRAVVMFLSDDIDVRDKSALMMMSILFGKNLTDEKRMFILKEEYGILLTEEDEREVQGMSTFAEGYYSMGIEEGKNIGIVEGKFLGLSQVARNMYQQGINLETICKWTNLTMKEVLSLLENDNDTTK